MWRLGVLEHVVREAKQYKRLQLLDTEALREKVIRLR